MILETILGVGMLGSTATVVVLALRNGGLKAEVQQATTFRKAAEEAMTLTVQSASRERTKYKAQLADLQSTIEVLENELEKSSRPGDHRARIQRLLSKTPDPKS